MIKWNNKKTYTEDDIARMQQEAVERVHEFQNRARNSFFYEPPSSLLSNMEPPTAQGISNPSYSQPVYPQSDQESFDSVYREYYGQQSDSMGHDLSAQPNLGLPAALPQQDIAPANHLQESEAAANEPQYFSDVGEDIPMREPLPDFPNTAQQPENTTEDSDNGGWQRAFEENWQATSPQQYQQTADGEVVQAQGEIPANADDDDPISGLLSRFNIDKDVAIIVGLLYLLHTEKADTSLLMGLAYLLL